MVRVFEAKTKRQMKTFARFPLKLYKQNPYYVPTFISDDVNMKNVKKNYSAEGCLVKCFLAERNGEIVGRIAGIIVTASNLKFNTKCVRFSRIDFIEDEEVAKALLKAVENFGRQNGMDTIHGPWGFNDTDREGMLTFGFDQTSTYATNYSYPYYVEILQKLGYKPENEWIEYRFNVPTLDLRYKKLAKAVQERYGFTDVAETLSLKQVIKRYGDKFFDCYNEAYRNLDGYVDIKGNAKKLVLKQFATVINEKYYSIIVDKKTDDVVAFGIAIPALGKVLQKHGGSMARSAVGLLRAIKKPKALELCIVGVHPGYRRMGANAMVINRIWTNVVNAGITDIVGNPMLTTNFDVLAQWKTVPHEIIKRRSTFIKAINK
ncbi:MAG: N-acetyltransferase [Clostridia bacterium]|nr:N-acetyltransferase [Clostridia bacterium]